MTDADLYREGTNRRYPGSCCRLFRGVTNATPAADAAGAVATTTVVAEGVILVLVFGTTRCHYRVGSRPCRRLLRRRRRQCQGPSELIMFVGIAVIVHNLVFASVATRLELNRAATLTRRSNVAFGAGRRCKKKRRDPRSR